mgnify:CR=1 FL=1
MKEKSSIEKKAQEKQTDLLSKALSEASNAGGHWLNASGKKFPRLYPQGGIRQPVQCTVHGVAFGQIRLQNQPVHALH